MTPEEYILKVKSLLDEYPKFNEQDIDDNINYFNYCLSDGLSAYKSLLFFDYYLDSLDS